ncbi:MAG TPA: hypothetical protein VMT52_02090 [Planctomycetota bacterium]|nr:hypothetical protein [Planctomycetota bacterium]
MKKIPSALLILAFAACFTLASFALIRGGSALGQSPIPRFQLDSYAAAVQGTGAEFGCYILDNTTGELWHSLKGLAPTKIGKLEP